MTDTDYRKEFLLKMYRQMFSDVENQFRIMWQAIVATLASIGLVAGSDRLIPMDLAYSIIIILCSWTVLTIQDASYWYNRNLVIISNIERQFLENDDLKFIHYYFGKHRPKNKMISHLKLQVELSLCIGALAIIYHFSTRIAPGFNATFENIEPLRGLPILIAIAAIFRIIHKSRDQKTKYDEFLENSPGIAVDTSNVSYGTGHGHSSKKNKG